jgi:hypothetical protein
MSNVTELPPHENMSVNQALDIIKRKDLKKVLVIGIDSESLKRPDLVRPLYLGVKND